MVVETETAFRNQTLRHFIHTFIHNYNRESAADRTMRSRYVPKNIKMQLLAAVRECSGDRVDSERVTGIANMGLFIDVSCGEIVYYHSITSSVLQWTLSLYTDETRIVNVVRTVLEDMGRIGDDEMRFILEKYRYNEERRSAGHDTVTQGVDRVLSFLRTKQFDPDTSYVSYYAQSMMVKLARSLLRNSALLLNCGVVDPTTDRGRVDGDPGPCDPEDDRLYDDYKRHRERLAAVTREESLEVVERVLGRDRQTDAGSTCRSTGRGVAARNVFDQVTTRSGADSGGTESRSCRSVASSYSSVSPDRRPPSSTLADLEVEEIFGNSTDGRTPHPRSRSRTSERSLCSSETSAEDRYEYHGDRHVRPAAAADTEPEPDDAVKRFLADAVGHSVDRGGRLAQRAEAVLDGSATREDDEDAPHGTHAQTNACAVVERPMSLNALPRSWPAVRSRRVYAAEKTEYAMRIELDGRLRTLIREERRERVEGVLADAVASRTAVEGTGSDSDERRVERTFPLAIR